MFTHFLRNFFLLSLAAFVASIGAAQTKSLPFTEEVLTPDAFSQVLKDEWFFLKDATEAYLKSVEKRGEFETSVEFEQRVARSRAEYIAKVNDHIKEKKLFRRVFSVMFKTTLNSYDADAETYSLACSATSEVPYDLPSVMCFVPSNPYVFVKDTVASGYRMSQLGLKFDPDLKWKVDRATAMAVKGDEANIVFRVRMMLDVRQNNFTNQAKFRIVAKDIALMDQHTKKIYWKELLQ